VGVNYPILCKYVCVVAKLLFCSDSINGGKRLDLPLKKAFVLGSFILLFFLKTVFFTDFS
jgi:hypothetical protein